MMAIEPRPLTAEERTSYLERFEPVRGDLTEYQRGEDEGLGVAVAVYAALLHAEQRIAELEEENERLRDLLRVAEHYSRNEIETLAEIRNARLSRDLEAKP